jgi:hypothetical protein
MEPATVPHTRLASEICSPTSSSSSDSKLNSDTNSDVDFRTTGLEATAAVLTAATTAGLMSAGLAAPNVKPTGAALDTGDVNINAFGGAVPDRAGESPNVKPVDGADAAAKVPVPDPKAAPPKVKPPAPMEPPAAGTAQALFDEDEDGGSSEA